MLKWKIQISPNLFLFIPLKELLAKSPPNLQVISITSQMPFSVNEKCLQAIRFEVHAISTIVKEHLLWFLLLNS